MQNFWNENAVTRELARHSIGRKILSAVGSRFMKKKMPKFDLLLDLQDRWGVSKHILKHGEYDAELCRLVKGFYLRMLYASTSVRISVFGQSSWFPNAKRRKFFRSNLNFQI